MPAALDSALDRFAAACDDAVARQRRARVSPLVAPEPQRFVPPPATASPATATAFGEATRSVRYTPQEWTEIATKPPSPPPEPIIVSANEPFLAILEATAMGRALRRALIRVVRVFER